MNRKEIKEEAKKFAWQNKWNIWKIILIIGAVSAIISSILDNIPGTKICTGFYDLWGTFMPNCHSTIFGSILNVFSIFISYALSFISCGYILELVRNKKTPDIDKLIDAVKKNYKMIIIVSVLASLIITIGTVLFIIPGIIAGLGLTFLMYVAYDNPGLSEKEILKKAWDLTNGYKADILIFYLSFIPWLFACIVLVPIIWIVPYFTIASAMYYEKLKENKKL